jgi:hypothetical protein
VILRLAIVAASLAWGGFVFTHTVGDPDRGEEVAKAVLADDAARAQVVSPITNAVMSSTGLPPEQRPFVASRVDQILLEPDGARTFTDSFAGGWARMLGDDDRRGSRVDVRPFVDDIAANLPGLDPSLIPTQSALPASVPVPRERSPWLGDLRQVVNALVLPLALAAAVGMAISLAIGDRRWALRRIGLWAVLAGGAWVAGPVLAVWAAQRWATGADEVVRVAVEEAVSGLRTAAILLSLLGLGAFVMSFFIVGSHERAPEFDDRGRPTRVDRRRPYSEAGVGRQPPTPLVPRRPVASSQPVARPHKVAPTMTMPVQPVDGHTPSTDADADADADALWDYYTEPDE